MRAARAAFRQEPVAQQDRLGCTRVGRQPAQQHVAEQRRGLDVAARPADVRGGDAGDALVDGRLRDHRELLHARKDRRARAGLRHVIALRLDTARHLQIQEEIASAIAMQKDWQAAIKAIEAEKDSFSNEITLRIDKKELKNAETINQSEALQNTESLVATKLLENQRETSPQNQNLTISKTPKKRFGLVIAGLSFALMMIGGIGVFALWMMQKNSNLDLKTEPVLIENEKKSVSLPTPEIKKTEVESTTTSPLQKTENKIDTQPPEKKAPPQVIEKPNTVATKSKEVATKPTPKKQTKKPVSVDDIINDN